MISKLFGLYVNNLNEKLFLIPDSIIQIIAKEFISILLVFIL